MAGLPGEDGLAARLAADVTALLQLMDTSRVSAMDGR
jgi:hypothetical protein